MLINFSIGSLNSQKLYVSNSNECKEIIFNKPFAPTGISSPTGGLYIGVYSAGNTGSPGGGTTRFNQPVTFANVSADIQIFGGNVEFEGGASPANYSYTGTTGLNEIYAHGSCAQGDLLFKGGTVAVTKSAERTFWHAARKIVTYPNSTVNYTNSGTVVTEWHAGDSIITKDNVTFANSGSGLTQWFAGKSIYSIDCNNTITFTHTGTGETEWQAVDDINIKPSVSFTKLSTGGAITGETKWFTQNGDIKTHNNVTFRDDLFSGVAGEGTEWSAGRNIIVDDSCNITPVTINFKNTGGGNDGHIWWSADSCIEVLGTNKPPMTVEFENTSVNTTGDNYMWWQAINGHIYTNKANIYFTTNGEGKTGWSAKTDILAEDCNREIVFTNTNGSGSVRWQAEFGKIEVFPQVTFTKTHTTNGETVWQAKTDIITHDSVTFKSSGNAVSGGGGTAWLALTGNIHVDQNCGPTLPKAITFTNNSTTDDFIWWVAHQSIQVVGNSGANENIKVDFTNKATNDNEATNNMKWNAQNNDIDIDYADVTFTTTGKGYTEWYAHDSILMDFSKIDFSSGTAAPATNKNTFWHAETGNIHANRTPITFKNDGAGYTWWKAGQNILLHDQSPTSFTDASTSNYLKLEAVVGDIRTGKSSPLTIKHDGGDYVGPSDSAYIELRAGRNVWTQSAVDIVNGGKGNRTTVHANQDIRIDSTFTFAATDLDGIDSVKFRAATGDIIINVGTADMLSTHFDLTSYDPANDWCDASRAAVNFTLAGKGATEWWAKQNIIATDTIHFHYDETNNSAGSILLHADVNNIDLRRPFKIDIDSDSKIRLEALNSSTRDNKHSGHGGTYNGTADELLHDIDLHNETFGSIRTSDSVVINRTSVGAVNGGHTEIEAYNDIQTAMFDFTGTNTVGDTTDIISRMGDIWLGYSWKNPAHCTTDNAETAVGFDLNRFIYRVPDTQAGKLSIKSGFSDMAVVDPYSGGNIYFTHIVDSLGKGGKYETEISIPYSNMFTCGGSGAPLSGDNYERAGIIGGVARCRSTAAEDVYRFCTDTGLIHIGNNGNLTVNAGTKGNIIFNNGAYLQFQGGTGDAKFLTQYGDIDMRHPFNVDSMLGDVLFYANSFETDKTRNLHGCEDCREKRNNVYLQDFRYIGHDNSGSVFIGADNNIKIQYGGLYGKPVQRDPFYNINGYTNDGCGSDYHCDADTTENQARALILNFDKDTTGVDVTSGGFAAVASDLIDVYKKMIYHGGSGSGMGAVPDYGTLHGEGVAGYGLYIKTQGNKENWRYSTLTGAACSDDCGSNSYLHNTARVTFHSDARIYTQGQRSLIASPVLESYGHLDLNTHLDAGTRTSIQIRTDSLIIHDSLIIDGPRTSFASWTPLRRNMPVFKLGHHRATPPFSQSGNLSQSNYCRDCYTHSKDEERSVGSHTSIDTIYVTYRNGATVPRLHTLVADHAALTFLTDDFDLVYGNPTLNAKFYADTFKIRNHVELIEKGGYTHDGFLELVSEPQMSSSDYAGIYTRHLHMEPVAPECSNFGYSQLWPLTNTLDIIPTSTIGGYGWLHSDVHVSIGGILAPGYTSLGGDGNCYESGPGILRMNDLRIDKDARLKISLGNSEGDKGHHVENYSCEGSDTEYKLGEFADLLDVDSLSVYGEAAINVEIRPGGLTLAEGESQCFPILRYKKIESVTVLSHLTLVQPRLTSKDHNSIDGSYDLYLFVDEACGVLSICVSNRAMPRPVHMVTIPPIPGVVTVPPAGKHYVDAHGNFSFKVIYPGGVQPMTIKTIRATAEEELVGKLNENGEYEYLITQVYKDLVLSFTNPSDAALPGNGARIWSHNETVYISVDREDVVGVYSITGQLIKRIEVSEGNTSVPMMRGVYIVTLKDGSVHKVIVK
ncbi:MAG: T9SS type A sorting domain-containing protein [Tannerella sp.]|nr:T9SS type A sorting domain-containing protein [Tannerella sp.]